MSTKLRLNPKKKPCQDCRQPKIWGEEIRWCGPCEIHQFKLNFDKWTSGHPKIDSFIRETQLNATGFFDYLEWIPYEHLQNVSYLAKGGFAKVYSAKWIRNGQAFDYYKVALKCPHNQEEVNQLLSEVNSVVFT